jgi:hypothetical protein
MGKQNCGEKYSPPIAPGAGLPGTAQRKSAYSQLLKSCSPGGKESYIPEGSVICLLSLLFGVNL